MKQNIICRYLLFLTLGDIRYQQRQNPIQSSYYWSSIRISWTFLYAGRCIWSEWVRIYLLSKVPQSSRHATLIYAAICIILARSKSQIIIIIQLESKKHTSDLFSAIQTGETNLTRSLSFIAEQIVPISNNFDIGASDTKVFHRMQSYR